MMAGGVCNAGTGGRDKPGYTVMAGGVCNAGTGGRDKPVLGAQTIGQAATVEDSRLLL